MKPKIAFYAPLKPPTHPIPSGDREIARNLLDALGLAGFDAFLASEVISYQKRPSRELFEQRRRTCEAEAGRLLSLWHGNPQAAPDLWMTYHPYCKSPDWIGPAVCGALSIPYVTVEACRTRQDTDADWADGRAQVQAALRGAAANFCMKPSDRAYLESFLPDASRIVPLAPFIDLASLPDDGEKAEAPLEMSRPTILSVGMMRPGAKIESYRLLSEALVALETRDWNLVIVGDGPGRAEVETMFGFAADRVHFTGALTREGVIAWMRTADVFVWPGVREAIGIVFLEAQALGLPVVAYATAGVPTVVADGESGLLAEAFDEAAFRSRIKDLLRTPGSRASIGAKAREYVKRHHGPEAAAATLKAGLEPLIAAGAAGRPVSP